MEAFCAVTTLSDVGSPTMTGGGFRERIAHPLDSSDPRRGSRPPRHRKARSGRAASARRQPSRVRAPVQSRRNPSCRRCRGRRAARRVLRAGTGRCSRPAHRPARHPYGGQDHPTGFSRADQRVQAGFQTRCVMDDVALDTMTSEIVPHETHKVEIAVARDGGEGNQPRQHFTRRNAFRHPPGLRATLRRITTPAQSSFHCPSIRSPTVST